MKRGLAAVRIVDLGTSKAGVRGAPCAAARTNCSDRARTAPRTAASRRRSWARPIYTARDGADSARPRSPRSGRRASAAAASRCATSAGGQADGARACSAPRSSACARAAAPRRARSSTPAPAARRRRARSAPGRRRSAPCVGSRAPRCAATRTARAPLRARPPPRFSRQGIGFSGSVPATRSISSSAARRRSSAVAAACRAAAASPRAAAAPASAASPRRRQAAPSAAAPRAAAASRSAAASEVRSASPSAAADLSTASCAARRRQRMRGAALLSACAGARCAPLAGPCCNLWQHTLMFGTPSAGRRWCRTGAPAPALAGARGTQLQAAAQHVRHISATASEGIAWHAGRGPARVRCSASHRSACPAKA